MCHPNRIEALQQYVCSDIHVVFESWFNFKIALNKGAAWGLFRNLSPDWRVPFFVVISAAVMHMLEWQDPAACEAWVENETASPL